MPNPVQKDDILAFKNSEKKVINVFWTQSGNHNEPYYAVAARNRNRENALVVIYIQKDLYDNPNELNRFAVMTGDDVTMKVTGDCQYGQKETNGDFRYVVYHNRDRKIWQFRFTTATMEGSKLDKELIEGIGFENAWISVIKSLGGLFGHELHNF